MRSMPYQILDKKNLYSNDSVRKAGIDKRVMLMIARDVQPFSVVNDKGFQDLLEYCDPRYKMPSKTYF